MGHVIYDETGRERAIAVDYASAELIVGAVNLVRSLKEELLWLV